MMRLSWWIGVATILIGVLSTVAVSMTQFSHNEEMYVAAGALVADGLIPYRDFSYLQTPYLAWVYGAMFRLLPEPGWYLLAAKSVSLAAYGVSLALVFQIARGLTSSRTGALLITAFVATNLLIIMSTAEASNYAMPLALVLGALRACQADRPRWWLSGILMGAAVGVKLTFAPLLVPLIVAAMRQGSGAGTRFLLGLTLGLAPLAAHLLAGIDVVVFNNVGYHRMQAQWRIAHDWGPTLTLLSKLRLAGSLIVHEPPTLWALAALVTGLAWTRQLPQSPQAVLGMGLIGTAVAAALVPTPVFPQYFALPAALGILAIACVWQAPLTNDGTRALPVLTLFVLGAALSAAPVAWRGVALLTDHHNWAAFRMRDAGREVRLAIDAHGELAGRPIATLSPIMALENGLPIYPDLATGSFAYWPGDMLTNDERRRYVTTSPSTIGALLAATPPAAVLVGFRGELDTPLRAYAESHDFSGPFPLRNGAEFYVAR